MNAKTRVIVSVASVLFIVAAAVLGFSLLTPAASAAEYMNLSADERVSHAQNRYTEFSDKANKEFEVLITFSSTNADEVVELLKGEDDIIAAFHYFSANGETAAGGYTECSGETIEAIMDDYYRSIYNMVVGQIDSHDEYVAGFDQEDKDALKEAEWRLGQMILQKKAMENGDFMISGIRLKATGESISKWLASEKIALVEILEFDNNSFISPML